MMAVDFSGTWKLYEQENAEEFLRAICELQQNKSLVCFYMLYILYVRMMCDVFHLQLLQSCYLK